MKEKLASVILGDDPPQKRTWCPQKAPVHTYTYTYTYTYAQQQMRAVEWLVEKGSILSF